MKLSEAIRLGAMLKPQAFKEYFADGGSCAFGAALNACGVDAEHISSFEPCTQLLQLAVEHQWPLSVAQCAPCPACDRNHQGKSICNTIPHLNDDHRWTREQIADWIETIEQQREVQAPAVTVPAKAEA